MRAILLLLLLATPAIAANLGSIMPLGDSITWGDAWTWSNGELWGDGTGVDTPIPGGYRQEFYSDLTAAGASFQFVGTQTSNSTPILAAAGESANQGEPGYFIANIDGNLDGSSGGDPGYWLSGIGSRPAIYPSDILLMIGTNDLISGSNPAFDVPVELDQLLMDIFSLRPAAHVFIGELIPIPAFPSADAAVREFNFLLPGEVAKFTAIGDQITLVNTFDSFVNADGSDNMALTFDGVHPDQQGYDLIGDAFAAAVLGNPLPQKPGDANMDGIINGDDYTLIDNGFDKGLSGWQNGDFNGDGVVNGDDYAIIDNAFNAQGSAGDTSEIDVPEPICILLLISLWLFSAASHRAPPGVR